MIKLFINGKFEPSVPINSQITHTDAGLKLTYECYLHNEVELSDTYIEIITHMENDYGTTPFEVTETAFGANGLVTFTGETSVDNIIRTDFYVNDQDIFGGPVPDLLWTIRDPGYRSSPRPITIRPHELLNDYSSVISIDQPTSLKNIIETITPAGFVKSYSGSELHLRPRIGNHRTFTDDRTLSLYQNQITSTRQTRRRIYKITYTDVSALNTSCSISVFYDPDAEYPLLNAQTRKAKGVSDFDTQIYMADYPAQGALKDIVEVDISTEIANACLFTPTLLSPCYTMSTQEKQAFFRTKDNQDRDIGGFIDKRDFRYIRRALLLYYFINHYRYDEHTRRRSLVSYKNESLFGLSYEDTKLYGAQIYVNQKVIGSINSISYNPITKSISNLDIDSQYNLNIVPPAYKTQAWTKYKEDANAPKDRQINGKGEVIDIPIYRAYDKHTWL